MLEWPTAFAQRVQAAVGIDPPAPDSAEQPAGDSDTDAVGDQGAPDTEGAPKPSVTKAVDCLLDLFSRFNG